MNTILKRFIICVLAVLAAFAMTSCGKNDGTEDSGNAKPPRGDGNEYLLSAKINFIAE